MSEPWPKTRDGRKIAAWVIKGDPRIFKVEEEAVAAEGEISSWSLGATYRNDLLAPGQRCFLWLSRGRGTRTGLIAAGTIAGYPSVDDAIGVRGWINESEAKRKRAFVPVDLRRLLHPITRQVLLNDPVLRNSELIRAPQMSNPVVLRPDELRALDRLDLTLADTSTDDEADFYLWGDQANYCTLFDPNARPSEQWAVFKMDHGSDQEELELLTGSLAQAGKWIATIADEACVDATIQAAGPPAEGTLAVVELLVEDGVEFVVRDGERSFTAWVFYPDETKWQETGSWSTLREAIEDITTDGAVSP